MQKYIGENGYSQVKEMLLNNNFSQLNECSLSNIEKMMRDNDLLHIEMRIFTNALKNVIRTSYPTTYACTKHNGIKEVYNKFGAESAMAMMISGLK